MLDSQKIYDHMRAIQQHARNGNINAVIEVAESIKYDCTEDGVGWTHLEPEENTND